MPKTPSHKLFRLIKSLSGPEKRYFKVFVNDDGKRDSKYIRLFDAIDAQEVFDEEALKRTVYPDKPIESRKYSELKAYLYDTILKSLQAYDEKSAVDFRLKGLLQSIRVLYRRGLFEDARGLLAKAKKQAARHEHFNTLLELLDWEKQIAYARTDIAFLDRELERIDREEKQVLEQLGNLSDYRNIFLRLLVNLRKDNTLRQRSERVRLDAFVDTPLLRSFEQAQSYHARVLYHRIYSLYHYATGDLRQFYETGRRLIALMESEPHFLREDVSEYISALSNFIRSCGELRRFGEVERYLEKLRRVKPLTRDDELKIHRQYYQLKFSLCIEKGDFVEGMEALGRHLRERDRFDPVFFENYSFYIAYFYLAFGAERYEDALTYLNKALSFSRSIERQDLQTIARILNLIVHYELGNTVLLESLLRSTYRFLKKRDALHEVERKILNFVREAIEAPSAQARRQVFRSHRAVIAELREDPFARGLLLRQFDVLAWLESKIQGKSFAEVVREKFAEKNEAFPE